MARTKKTAFRSALDFDSSSLAQCLQKIASQHELLAIVRAALPTSIAEQVYHCVTSGERLILYTNSAAWASQIRFFQSSILSKLAESGARNTTRLQVKVLIYPEQIVETKGAQLPSAEIVDQLVKSVDEESNDELDKALAKLAKTLQRRVKG